MDITSNVNFIQTNEIFQAVIQQGKVERRGETCAKIPISDPDMSKLSSYILENMKEPPPPPNAEKLQEFVLFNIIYYGGHHGRESKRDEKENFHQDNREYIYQIMKECDKNHKEDDIGESNEG